MSDDLKQYRIDAVILCGGKLEESLREHTDAPVKGFIELAGRTMVEYVLEALRQVERINNIVLVAHPPYVPDSVASRIDIIANEGTDMMSSLASGVKSLVSVPDYVLVLPCDLPLLTVEAINHFIDKSLNPPVDITYGILSKNDSQRVFPDVHHTYVDVREGTFCGTGLFMMKPGMVRNCEELFRKLTAQRKNTLGLASMLGPLLIVKFMLKMLSVEDAEKKLLELMGNVTGRAIITPYAEAGFNVDAPNELLIARRILEERLLQNK